MRDRAVLYKVYDRDGKPEISKYKYSIEPFALPYVIEILIQLKEILEKSHQNLYPKFQID